MTQTKVGEHRLVTEGRQLRCTCGPAQAQGLWEGRSTDLFQLKLLRDLYVPFSCSCTCGCCRHLWREMGLSLLPMALLALSALLLWPTLAHDSEEPNVRCGGEC